MTVITVVNKETKKKMETSGINRSEFIRGSVRKKALEGRRRDRDISTKRRSVKQV